MSIDKRRYGSTLFKMTNLKKNIMPLYNRHVHRILSKLDEGAKYSDKADTLGQESIGDIIKETLDLLSYHRDYNSNTVHGETATMLGLGTVANLRLATEEEAIAGTTHEKYMTPYMVNTSIVENALKPLNAHLNNKNRPHGETAAMIGSMTRSQVNTLVNSKYNKTEQVVNATHGMMDTKKTYATLLAEFRANLPPQNFTHGFVPPARVASGTPNATSIVLSDDRRWTQISALINSPNYQGREVATATFNDTFTLSSALNFLRTTPPYSNLPDGSMVLFTLRERLGTATHTHNNGHHGDRYHDVAVGHVAVKYSSTNWQVL